MLNFMFLFAGTVSTNPLLTILGMLILVAGANAGAFGFDRYVLPALRKLVGRKPNVTAAKDPAGA